MANIFSKYCTAFYMLDLYQSIYNHHWDSWSPPNNNPCNGTTSQCNTHFGGGSTKWSLRPREPGSARQTRVTDSYDTLKGCQSTPRIGYKISTFHDFFWNHWARYLKNHVYSDFSEGFWFRLGVQWVSDPWDTHLHCTSSSLMLGLSFFTSRRISLVTSLLPVLSNLT